MHNKPKYLNWKTATSTIIILSLLAVAPIINQILQTASNFKSQLLCSEVFVAERDINEALASDIETDGFWYLAFFNSKISSSELNGQKVDNIITTDLWGLVKSQSLFREGIGCTIIKDVSAEELLKKQAKVDKAPQKEEQIINENELQQNISSLQVDKVKLKQAVDFTFNDDILPKDDPYYNRQKRTRALLVQYKGKIIAEQYAEGFDVNSRFCAWSMSKTIANSLVGILLREGKLAVNDNSLFESWQNDNRKNITVENLLKMESGLAFGESYSNPLGDAVQMIFNSYDAAKYAINQPLEQNPTEKWAYSSGTSNVLTAVIRKKAETDANYQRILYEELYGKLGMTSAIMAQDASGNFMLSSFMFATARDYLRYGNLYLNNGIYNNERIFPEGWVEYSMLTAADSQGDYASALWRRIPDTYYRNKDDINKLDEIAPDAFHMVGYQGQFITVIPSRELVIVRLGLSRGKATWNHPQLILKVLDSID